MNVYDFDGTIYRGDSTIDFYFFCLRKHPFIIRRFPSQMIGFIKYKLHRISKKELKETFFIFLKDISITDPFLQLFWIKHKHKIEKWYLRQQQTNDLIISASPYFLLYPLCSSMNIALIASEVDCNTGKFISENCYGIEKVNRFHQRYPSVTFDNFYSDSYSDAPLKELANQAFMVRKGKITIWE